MAPSRLLRSILILVTLQALVLLWWCRLPLYFLVPAVLAIAIYSACEWRRLSAARGILSTRERRWLWRPDEGVEREFEFRGELVLWRRLLVLNGRDLRSGKLRLVLARDSLDSDDWRRLQVALRYSR